MDYKLNYMKLKKENLNKLLQKKKLLKKYKKHQIQHYQ